MDAVLARKLQFKDGALPVYCLHLPPSVRDRLQGTSLQEQLPRSKDTILTYVLLFASDSQVLAAAIPGILPRLAADAKCWIAYPKGTSGIKSDLNRDHGWEPLATAGYEPVTLVAIDDTWSAVRYRPVTAIKDRTRSFSQTTPVVIPGVDFERRIVTPPADLQSLLDKVPAAADYFKTLSFTNQKEYIAWIENAKKEQTRTRRLADTVNKLIAGKKNPAAQ
ncbi:YdeI/OmpD-associated family protein [Chitinophaga pendula]|uniref:YdeI/OmpD-associated family protein n=1 Tax=Chitinophaga TaxID=79328 RepID=UPI0012FD3151|nr:MULTISPECIES: YdeI/OmpD-associated family protein [Chitinophaga]UCJ08050.1 YdeI/OmpD-associated family protein [Chitinophaga pendula]